MRPLGRRSWAIAAGFVPAHGTVPEPEFTSRDSVSLLNAGDEVANVRITVWYTVFDQSGPYRLVVAPRRMRSVRINDLIFPEAVRLEEPYGLSLESDQPIVVQFTRMDTRAVANTCTMVMAWPQTEPAP